MEENNFTFLRNYKYVFLAVLVGLFLIALFFYGKRTQINQDKDAVRSEGRVKSLLANDPKKIQESFLNDVANNVNTKQTKSDIYFIAHRYFDNGGNIYEIYDYVHAHDSLQFLRNSESVRPDLFSKIEHKKLPTYYSEDGLIAFLVYLEAVADSGYGDIATLGTLAAQHAKIAYFSTIIASNLEGEKKEKRLTLATVHAEKAKKFIMLADKLVDSIVKGEVSSSQIVKEDILVGLNQYATALRYLKASGNPVVSLQNDNQIFDFTTKYARTNVPIFIHFTALLNASTLLAVDKNNAEAIKKAIAPILSLNPIDIAKTRPGIFAKILDAKIYDVPKYHTIFSLDIYSKKNIVELSEVVPEFKIWLIRAGWTGNDFATSTKK